MPAEFNVATLSIMMGGHARVGLEDNIHVGKGVLAKSNAELVAQAQHKMTETPVRTKWVCRPVGYDNEHVYRKFMDFGPSKLKKLKGAGII